MVLFVLAAVSGTGKSTVGQRLRALHPNIKLSVSHTTRAPRPGETDGVHYHFVDRARFEATVADDGFVEWAEYAGNLYGTARSTIEDARIQGHDLLFDVEVVGAAALKTAYPDAVTCFLLPTSWAALEDRLRGRGTETEASITRRLDTGRREITRAEGFDFLVTNDDLDTCVADVAAIYRAAGLRSAAQAGRLASLQR